MTDITKWWQKTIAYEIYVRSFYDSNGDGIGDLNGITEKLDYLKELGAGALWLTPCYRSPQADNGYDIADYYEIDEMFGTTEDMERLISEAGKRGIRIVMDLVFNHTSEQNPWFIESSSSRDNAKSDWYIWRDAKPDGSAPTNWRSIFGGSAWTWCEARQQYYLHTFLKEQPDLNWENPDMRNALYDAALYWVKKGVGGFRMDAVTYIKKPAFQDGTPDYGDGMCAIHNMTANTEGILDFLHEFKDRVQQGSDIFTVGEANGVSAAELPLWVGDNGVFDMIFEFGLAVIDLKDETNWAERRTWTLKNLKQMIAQSEQNTAQSGWYPIFFENHDLPRCISHYFPSGADRNMTGKLIGTLMYTLRGTPFVYQGQELGMRNTAWNDINDYNDVSTKSHYDFLISEGYGADVAMEAVHHFSRDSARTPMQWSAEKHAGFTKGEPWLRINDDFMECNAEREALDDQSILSWYRKLAKLRKNNSVLISGDYEELLCDSEQIFAFRRRNDACEAVVLLNFSDQTVSYDQAIIEGSELLITSASQHKTAQLQPYEAAVFQRNL
ncbi:MAG: alpha-glucosidase [Solobacterium sp.]|nr:alpha-glucosidase [Solobacterium sp.]